MVPVDAWGQAIHSAPVAAASAAASATLSASCPRISQKVAAGRDVDGRCDDGGGRSWPLGGFEAAAVADPAPRVVGRKLPGRNWSMGPKE